jgi:limonene-1,2-epoxide hydrolase
MGVAFDAVQTWWKVFEEVDLDDLARYVSPDAEIIMPGGVVLRGPDQLRQMLSAYRAAFPVMRHELVSVVEDDHRAAIELRVVMQHDGPFPTADGELAPTRKTIVIESVEIVEIDDGGQVKTWRTYFDQSSFLAQLGVA